MKTLNIIGCGKVGKTLGRLWTEKGVFEIGTVLNRSMQSSSSSVDFVRAGRPVGSFDEMEHADVFMIGVPDSHILDCCGKLAESGLLEPGNIVFHCSGAVPSADLSATKRCGALVGSVHPVKSFANPQVSVNTFEGTFCGVEGDVSALEVLCHAFETIGGKIFQIDPECKTVYHAATVIICNYLVALLEFGVRVYIESGLSRETALALSGPIVRETAENIFKFDTVQALTGPIARGDHKTVRKQLEALTTWNSKFGELYRRLGSIALDLSRKQGTASAESISVLTELLDGN